MVHYSARIGKYLEPAAGAPSRQLSGAWPAAACGSPCAPRCGRRGDRGAGGPPRGVEVEIDGARPGDRPDRRAAAERGRPEPLFVVVFADSGPPARRGAAPPAGGAARTAPLAQLERELRDTREQLQSTIEEYETATRGAEVGQRGAGLGQRGAAIDQRGAGDLQGGAAIGQRGAADRQPELAGKVESWTGPTADLRNLFESTRIATVFLDRHMVIRSFTPAMTASST